MDHRVDFFLVGQPKAGTTALHEMLAQHPGIFMSRLKEPQFFATDLRRRFDPKGWPVLPQSLDDYLALFANARPAQIRGESSTLYMPSKVAASHIKDFNPEAKVIAVVREPASLIRSLHLQTLKDRNEDERDLRRALKLESRRRNGEAVPNTSYRPQELFYTDHVRYVEQLDRYKDFERLVLAHDDLKTDNRAALSQIFEFLQLPEAKIMPTQANTSVVFRSHLAVRALHAISTGPTRWLGRVAPRRARHRALGAAYSKVMQTPPPADMDLAEELRTRFKPEVESLSDYLDRDFVSLWYPRPGGKRSVPA